MQAWRNRRSRCVANAENAGSRSPLRSGRSKTEVHWTSWTPLSASHVISRFSSAGRASALQAEGPRFDPWNRDENPFPIRLGESTPLTRRPKGKRLVPVFGKCGHGVIGSIPVFQTGGAGSFPVVHFFPAVIAQWQRSCFVNSRFPVQVRLTALRVKLERYHGGPISREHGFKSRTRYFIAP